MSLEIQSKNRKIWEKKMTSLQVKDFNIPLSLDERYVKIQKNKITLNY